MNSTLAVDLAASSQTQKYRQNEHLLEKIDFTWRASSEQSLALPGEQAYGVRKDDSQGEQKHPYHGVAQVVPRSLLAFHYVQIHVI